MFFSFLCFSPSSLVNLVLFIALIPAVIYASLRPLLCHGYARSLQTYQLLPTVGVMPFPDGQWDDLSLYLLFLDENISELKSFKYIKVWRWDDHGLMGLFHLKSYRSTTYEGGSRSGRYCL